MAIAYVRDTGKVTASNAGSIAATFGTNPTAGNFVAFGGSAYMPSGSPSFADNRGNTYTLHDKPTGGGTTRAFLAFCPNVTSGGTFTGTLTMVASSFAEMAGVEFSGIVSASPRDVTYDTNGSSTGSPVASGNTSATVQADELVLVALNLDGSGPFTALASSGYTSIYAETDGSIQAGAFAYKIVSATGVQSSTWTWTGGASTDSWAMIIDTFKAAAAAATGKGLLTLGVG